MRRMVSGMACGELLRGERERKLQIFEKEWLYIILAVIELADTMAENRGERVHIRQEEVHWGIGHTLCQI